VILIVLFCQAVEQVEDQVSEETADVQAVEVPVEEAQPKAEASPPSGKCLK
jgi:hypothetical protein